MLDSTNKIKHFTVYIYKNSFFQMNNNTINSFLSSSVENGNVTRSRVTLSKIDAKDKSKDAKRAAKQSIKVFNPLNAFLETVIVSAHKEITNDKRHLLLLSELLVQISKVKTLTGLKGTTEKAVKKLRFMFPNDETKDAQIINLLSVALANYRAFTKDASDNAIKAKITKDANFTDKLKAVSFATFAKAQPKAEKAQPKPRKPKAEKVATATA